MCNLVKQCVNASSVIMFKVEQVNMKRVLTLVNSIAVLSICHLDHVDLVAILLNFVKYIVKHRAYYVSSAATHGRASWHYRRQITQRTHFDVA